MENASIACHVSTYMFVFDGADAPAASSPAARGVERTGHIASRVVLRCPLCPTCAKSRVVSEAHGGVRGSVQYLAAWAIHAEDFGVDPHDTARHKHCRYVTAEKIEAARDILPEEWR